MKKIMLSIITLASLSTVFTSCKKDYVCECSKTYTSGSGSTTNDYSKYTYKDTRTNAESRCNANNDSGNDFFGNYSINCQIK